MKALHLTLSLFSITLFLTSCATNKIPATDNPFQKLTNARFLYDQQKDPKEAEKLIHEAEKIFLRNNNNIGLAEVYREMAFFVRSPAVELFQDYYSSTGFLDGHTTFNNRFQKSVEYYDRAAQIYLRYKKFGHLSNIFLNQAYSYEMLGQQSLACRAYNKSIRYHKLLIQTQPEIQIEEAVGFSSFSEFVRKQKKRTKCSG